jgi:hypothetical protein
LWALVIVAVAGCGGAAQPAPKTSGPKTDSSEADKKDALEKAVQGDKEPSGEAKKPTDGNKPAVPGKPIAEHEKDFMSGCAKSPDFKPYCDCAWGVFASIITKNEMDTNEVSEAKLGQVETKTAQACVDKIPESMVKEGFMKGCSKDKPAFKDYCECYWPELRKRFSIGEIANKETVKSERFATAGKEVAKKCAPKLPESVVKEGFMKGCTSGNAPAEKFCQCAWTQLRSVMNYAEIDMAAQQSTPEFKKGQEKIEKSCGKLRPGR